jgi:hypothetical protein
MSTRCPRCRLCGLALLCTVLGALIASAPHAEPFAPPGNPVVTAVSSNPEVDAVITVSVSNLASWAAFPGDDPWKLVPYMDGLSVDGNYPIAVDVTRGRLQYHLRITDRNKETWIDLLGPPVLTRAISFTVGLERGDPFATRLDEQHPATLVVMEGQWVVIAVILIIVIASLCVWLGVTTDIFRDTDLAIIPAGGRRPFSLVKVQMGFWFLLIFDSYLALWVITGEANTLNSSVLMLLGISAGAALGDVLISRSIASSAGPGGDAASSMPDSLPRQAAVPAASPAAGADDGFSGDAGPSPPSPASTRSRARIQGFLLDLLSDEHGVAFHRLQMLAWTTAIGIVFLSDVYYDLTMPQLGSNLLSLMGLSSGTYLGFRIPEAKQQAQTSTRAT